MGRFGNRVAVVVAMFITTACVQEQVRRPATAIPAPTRYTFAALRGSTVQVHFSDPGTLFGDQPMAWDRARFVVVQKLKEAGVDLQDEGTKRLDVVVRRPAIEPKDHAFQCVQVEMTASTGAQVFLPGTTVVTQSCEPVSTVRGGNDPGSALFFLGAALVQLAVTDAEPRARTQALFDALGTALAQLDTSMR